jgi:hypothetical protein
MNRSRDDLEWLSIELEVIAVGAQGVRGECCGRLSVHCPIHQAERDGQYCGERNKRPFVHIRPVFLLC